MKGKILDKYKSDQDIGQQAQTGTVPGKPGKVNDVI